MSDGDINQRGGWGHTAVPDNGDATPVPVHDDGGHFVGKASDGKKHFEVTTHGVASEDDFLTVEDD